MAALDTDLFSLAIPGSPSGRHALASAALSGVRVRARWRRGRCRGHCTADLTRHTPYERSTARAACADRNAASGVPAPSPIGPGAGSGSGESADSDKPTAITRSAPTKGNSCGASTQRPSNPVPGRHRVTACGGRLHPAAGGRPQYLKGKGSFPSAQTRRQVSRLRQGWPRLVSRR